MSGGSVLHKYKISKIGTQIQVDSTRGGGGGGGGGGSIQSLFINISDTI